MSILTNQLKGLTSGSYVSKQEGVMMTQGLNQAESVEEQCNYVNRGYNFMPNNNLPIYYHLGLRNHEDFSCANNRNTLQLTSEPAKLSTDKLSSSLEDLLKTYIMDSKARLDQYDTRLNNIEVHYTNMVATIKNLETQIGKLAVAIKEQAIRSSSSNIEKNVRNCKTITLKSGKELKTITERKCETRATKNAKEETPMEKVEKEPVKVTPGSIMFPDNPPKITTPLPYPQRFKKKNLDD